MKKLKFTISILNCFLVTLISKAGALCPENSCNPHNSCLGGCDLQVINGLSSCLTQNPLKAKENAIQAARNSGYERCSLGYFLQSDWEINKITTVDQQCFVKAEVEISCYK